MLLVFIARFIGGSSGRWKCLAQWNLVKFDSGVRLDRVCNHSNIDGWWVRFEWNLQDTSGEFVSLEWLFVEKGVEHGGEILGDVRPHVLQPCDVGVFGPLLLFWKSEINTFTYAGIPITKFNLHKHYAHAWECAFKPETIQSAFWKTGIEALDCNTLDLIAFESTLNTTTNLPNH